MKNGQRIRKLEARNGGTPLPDICIINNLYDPSKNGPVDCGAHHVRWFNREPRSNQTFDRMPAETEAVFLKRAGVGDTS